MSKPNVWFITGSSRGLGRSLTEVVLKKGDYVIATARNPQSLNDLVEQYGEQIHPLALDVSDEQAVSAAVEQAHQVFGRLDVVVNNAGYGDVASVEDVTLDDFRAQIDTNFYGVVYVSKAVVPILRKQGSGHIIQISSVGGRIATMGLAAYQSAKWAVGGFSEVLAQEVAPFGIKVTVIEPGGMRTDWAGSSMTIPPISQPYEQTIGALARMLQEHSGQFGSEPEKFAEVISELALLPEAPLRLLLGQDAVDNADAAQQARAATDAKWRQVSETVNFSS
ncbi:short-chain dehydrogenase/reductase [Bacillus sp. FJAT-27264]|uniref:SDR family NAD(P)-dependent oxidoreductase n=1 Tax=Paenibacillus sp. (strain DSM 101736 / FJAT-27264) TaxID=1850362 RepID=UPI000807FB85|nr:SDR family NAD(P)-dependent oxidoreductase [Bacillus sp. FJAT-27264]OBZ19336.1 short-chain dehydrogenase/reductase [Bacillus sp. FJAT-27264]